MSSASLVKADYLIDAVDPDVGEVVAQGTKVAFGVGKQFGIHVPLDHLALNFPGWCAPIRATRPAALSVRFHPLYKDTRGRAQSTVTTPDEPGSARPSRTGRSPLEQIAQIQLQAGSMSSGPCSVAVRS